MELPRTVFFNAVFKDVFAFERQQRLEALATFIPIKLQSAEKNPPVRKAIGIHELCNSCTNARNAKRAKSMIKNRLTVFNCEIT